MKAGKHLYAGTRPISVHDLAVRRAKGFDLEAVFDGRAKNWKLLDYVAAWFMKAADYGTQINSTAAFVSTNSICQGQQTSILWPVIFQTGHEK